MHSSALFAFGMLTVFIAFGYLPGAAPAAGVALRISAGVVVTLLLYASLAAREYGHALAARRCGRAVTGVTLYLVGGTAHIDERGLRPSDDIAIGLAGPATSAVVGLAMFGVGMLVLRAEQTAAALLLDLAIVNGLLAAVNLVPALPFDAGRVARGLLWRATGSAVLATRRMVLASVVAGYVVLAGGWALALYGRVLEGLWLVGTGWLLGRLAQAFGRRATARFVLADLTAGEICVRDLPALGPAMSVAEAAEVAVPGPLGRVFPVLFGERVVGVVAGADLLKALRGGDVAASVSSLMVRAYDMPAAQPGADALDAYDAAAAGPLKTTIVLLDGVYVGLVCRDDVEQYIRLSEERVSRLP